MKTRTAILGSVAWFVLVLALGFGTLYYAWSNANRAERRRFEPRARAMGSAAGTFMTIGWGIIWVTWAVRRRKERLQQEASRPERSEKNANWTCTTCGKRNPAIADECQGCGSVDD